MDNFAKLPPSDRREIIREVATRMSVDFTIIEKDFWVCWTLASLFALPPGHAPMIFKGGTALSKAYGLIQRFSEDIDVVADVQFFLSQGLSDPAEAVSKTQRLERMAALDKICAEYIGGSLINELRQQFTNRLGSGGGWELTIDPEDRFRHTLLFQYPASAPDIEHTYIRGRVKIELGWRSVTQPSEVKTINSYVADQIPMLMSPSESACTVLTPERTFWEKVTALHAESFRDGLPPRFYSRYYSDVAEMLRTKVGETSSKGLSMLDEVRRYKELYYYTAWARYDLAVPGSLAIVPSEEKIRELASDYRSMRMMFFSDPPPVEEIMNRLRQLQQQINAG